MDTSREDADDEPGHQAPRGLSVPTVRPPFHDALADGSIGIDIHLRSSFSSAEGTWIRQQQPDFESPGAEAYPADIIARTLAVPHQTRIEPRLFTSSSGRVSVLVDSGVEHDTVRLPHSAFISPAALAAAPTPAPAAVA